MTKKPPTKTQLIRNAMWLYKKDVDTISSSTRKDKRVVRCFASLDDERNDRELITYIYLLAKQRGFEVKVERKKNKGYITPDSIIVTIPGTSNIV